MITPVGADPGRHDIQGDDQLHGPPRVHTDGDGSTEGSFRIATIGSDGGFMTTEPVGFDGGCR